MKQQKGFTLIELIMVIVILGILAATALPKFVSLSNDARVAAMKAVEGTMRSSNAIIYAKAAIGNAMGAISSVSINGQTVTTNYGFASDLTNLAKVMDIPSSGVGGDFNVATANEIFHQGAIDNANCRVTYGNATSSAAPPTYTLLTSGC